MNYVLIPAYKPDEKLIATVASLLEKGAAVLVVDDGSGAEYGHIFDEVRKLSVEVISYPDNRGKGSALKTGIRRLMADENVTGIVTADADGQHRTDDILNVAAALDSSEDTVVLGVRRFAQSHVPTRSRIGNWITKIGFYLVTGIRISDTQTGLRGLPKKLFDELVETEGDRYEYEMNVLLNLNTWRAHVLEVPIETVYIEGNKSSSFNAAKDAFRIFKQILKFSASSLISGFVDYALYLLLCWLIPVISFIPASIAEPAAIWIVVARIVSSTLNFTLNRFVVFKQTGKNCMLKYILLAAVMMLVTAVGVDFLVGIKVNKLLAKIIVELPLFFVNYICQRKFVFNLKTERKS